MNKLVECVLFVVGLMAALIVVLPAPCSMRELDMTIVERVIEHPFAALIALGSLGHVGWLTLRTLFGRPTAE